ncbi:MAG TPA: response regulator [Rhizomicrobium sp.]|nr:response regulator [Rhizomicrobium sp.]
MSRSFENLKILVIEDKEHMRALLRRLLGHIGVRVINEANDGQAALLILRDNECDLILTDMDMAPMDGLTFTRQVRASRAHANLPIIMISGHTERAKVEAARDAGVNEFLVKPVTPANLVSRITEIMERPRSFVQAKGYSGPDRRRRQTSDFSGPGRREGDHPNTQGTATPKA